MGPAFEEICREHARQYSQERFPAPAQEIGRIWDADYDIDIAGELLDGSMLLLPAPWQPPTQCYGIRSTLGGRRNASDSHRARRGSEA